MCWQKMRANVIIPDQIKLGVDALFTLMVLQSSDSGAASSTEDRVLVCPPRGSAGAVSFLGNDRHQ